MAGTLEGKKSSSKGLSSTVLELALEMLSPRGRWKKGDVWLEAGPRPTVVSERRRRWAAFAAAAAMGLVEAAAEPVEAGIWRLWLELDEEAVAVEEDEAVGRAKSSPKG